MKRTAPLRFPAGSTIGGRSVGGRFVSRDQLTSYVGRGDGDTPERLLSLALEQLDRATAAHERLERRFQDDPKRYAAKTASAENERLAWERIVNEMESQLTPEDEGEFSDEWEMGFDYNSSQGHTAGKDFDLNIRIRRIDGAPFGFHDAQAAFRSVRYESEIPPGYKMAAINWRRPYRASGWRRGSVDDVGAFANAMYVHAHDESSTTIQPATGGLDYNAWDFGQAWRLGSVRK